MQARPHVQLVPIPRGARPPAKRLYLHKILKPRPKQAAPAGDTPWEHRQPGPLALEASLALSEASPRLLLLALGALRVLEDRRADDEEGGNGCRGLHHVAKLGELGNG
jgi:hypothetical protein